MTGVAAVCSIARQCRYGGHIYKVDNRWRAEISGPRWAGAPARVQEHLQEFARLSASGLTWREARDRLAELWPVPEVLAALADAAESEPFALEVELGGIPDEVARWLNPLVLSVRRCDWPSRRQLLATNSRPGVGGTPP